MSIYANIKSEMMSSTAISSGTLNHLIGIDGIQVSPKIAQEMEGTKIQVSDIMLNRYALALQKDTHLRAPANDNFTPVANKKAA